MLINTDLGCGTGISIFLKKLHQYSTMQLRLQTSQQSKALKCGPYGPAA